MVIMVIGGGVRGTGVIVDGVIRVIMVIEVQVTGVMVDAVIMVDMVIMVIGVQVTGVTVDGLIMVPGVRVTGVMELMGGMAGIAGNTFLGQLHYVDDLAGPFSTLND
jgi:hypothetical protein